MKKSEMNIEQAIRYLSGSASEEERITFELWLDEVADHKHQFDAFRKYWDITGSSYDNYDPDLGAGWEIVSRETVHKKVVPFRWKTVSFQLLKIASILLILLAGGFGVKYVMVKVGKPEGQLFVYQSEESFKKYILLDGTTIWLNKSSRIDIPGDFNKKSRSVFVEGEAYFEVAHNEDLPFVISTGEAVVKVVGTSFNLRAIKNENKVRVTVYSGHVVFYPVKSMDKVTDLLAGDRGVYDIENEEIRKESQNFVNDLAWKTGTLVFKNASLTEVCKVLSEYYHVQIETDEQLADSKNFTGNFHKASLDEILDIVGLTLDIEFAKKDNRIVAIP